jgi:hypothetical protein
MFMDQKKARISFVLLDLFLSSAFREESFEKGDSKRLLRGELCEILRAGFVGRLAPMTLIP